MGGVEVTGGFSPGVSELCSPESACRPPSAHSAPHPGTEDAGFKNGGLSNLTKSEALSVRVWFSRPSSLGCAGEILNSEDPSEAFAHLSSS